MKFFRHYSIPILVSGILHILTLYYIPFGGINIKMLTEQHINIELYKPKNIIVKDNIENNKKTIKSIKGTAPKEKKKKINYESLKIPIIDMPEMKVESKINIPDVSLPKQNVNTVDLQQEGSNEIKTIMSEIEKIEGYIKKPNKRNTLSDQNNHLAKDDFFEFTSLSNKERKIEHIPHKKTFTLENNTKLSLKFYIDQAGIPYNIIFVTRSDTLVEKIALEFIKGLRFEAVNYNKNDVAEIIIYFKVN